MLRRLAVFVLFVLSILAGSYLGGASEPAREIRIRPGTVVRAAPVAKAKRLGVVAEETSLEELGRQGSWIRVRFEGRIGWVSVSALAAADSPPLGVEVDPTHPVSSRPADPERLAQAKKLLGAGAKPGRLGPYALVSDLGDVDRLAFLSRIAAGIEEVYKTRYGRQPIGAPAETIVLFAREAPYLDFLRSDAVLSGAEASGHSGYGIVAIWDGGRPAREIAETLIHEIGHLLDRRAIGPQLPPWLDEGIADDLAHANVSELGAIDPSRLGGASFRAGERIQYFGARAALRQLVEALAEGQATPLPELLAMPWERFVGPGADLHYAEASFFVRYLLAGDEGRLAPGFRRFLEATAGGAAPSAAALTEALGRSWPELEAGFKAWVAAQES